MCQQQAHRAAGRLERRRVNPWSSASDKRIDGRLRRPQATAGWLDNSANCSRLRTKILVSFGLVLLPVLALLIGVYSAWYNSQRDEILDGYVQTAAAVASLVDATFD